MYDSCHSNYFHTIEYRFVYDIKLTNNAQNEIVNLAIADKSMTLYELNKNTKNARQRGFIFNQINGLTIKIYSSLPNINISFYLKFRISLCHRQFFKKLSQNHEYVKTVCNDLNNPFHFAFRKFTLENNSLNWIL